MALEIDYQHKTVAVFGGTSGINLGIARSFTALGADVGMCGRSADRLQGAARELESLRLLENPRHDRVLREAGLHRHQSPLAASVVDGPTMS